MVLATRDQNDPESMTRYEKSVSNIKEVKARDGIVISIVTRGDQLAREASDHVIEIPHGAGVACADSGNHSLAIARLSHRRAPRLRRGPAAQPGEVRYGGITRGKKPRNSFPLRQRYLLPFVERTCKYIPRMTLFPPSVRCACALAAITLVASLPLSAQTSAGVKSYTLAKVTVRGPSHFTSEQIAAAGGLRKGQQIDLAGVDAAADRLFKTGAIAKIGYSYSSVGNSMSVEFQITDASRFLPCLYDNFVWFADAESYRGRTP